MNRPFYEAEGYHQDFLTRNPAHPYIVINDLPKMIWNGSFLTSIARRSCSWEERHNGTTRATIRRAVQCAIR